MKAIVKENGEKQGESYATVITYPSVELKLSQYSKSIKMVNINGEEYQEIRNFVK